MATATTGAGPWPLYLGTWLRWCAGWAGRASGCRHRRGPGSLKMYETHQKWEQEQAVLPAGVRDAIARIAPQRQPESKKLCAGDKELVEIRGLAGLALKS